MILQTQSRCPFCHDTFSAETHCRGSQDMEHAHAQTSRQKDAYMTLLKDMM